MPIRATIRGVLIEADTVREMAAILDALGIGIDGPLLGGMDASATEPKGDRMASMLAALPDPQRTLLNNLTRGPAADFELRDALGFETNNQLAGVLGGIGKNAKRFGLTSDDIYRRSVEDSPNGRSYYAYALTSAMAELLRNDEGESG